MDNLIVTEYVRLFAIEPNLNAIYAAFWLLFVFGLLYNTFVAWLERHGYDQGYTAVLVVGGVLVTILMLLAILPGFVVAVMLAAFATSGLPMVVGSIWRHMRQRQQEADELRRIMEHGQKRAKGMAE